MTLFGKNRIGNILREKLEAVGIDVNSHPLRQKRRPVASTTAA